MEVRCKNYFEADSLIESLKNMAKYQEGERQQGILGVIATLENWPKVQIPDHCIVESVTNVINCNEPITRCFRCLECGK